MSSLSKNILQTLFVQIPNVFLGLIAGIFITRLLGPEGKGIYAIFHANIEVLILIFSFGLNMGLVYFIANKKIPIRKILGISSWILIISSALVCIFLLSTNDQQYIIFPEKHDFLFFRFFLLFSFIFGLITSIISGVFKGKKNFRIINLFTLINGGLNISVFAVLFFFKSALPFDITVKTIFIAVLSIRTLNTLLWIFAYAKYYAIIPQLLGIKKQEFIHLFKYTSVGYFGILVNFLSYRLDIWIVSYYKGSQELGYYALAVNVAQMLLLFSKTLAVVILPYLSERNFQERRRLYLLFSRINSFVVLCFIILFLSLGNFFIPIIYGADFIPSVAPFYILTIAMLFTCINQIQHYYFAANNMLWYCTLANIAGMLITVLLDFTLIPRIGIMGAAYATLASYSLNFFTLYYIQIRKLEKGWVNIFFPKKQDFKDIYLLFKGKTLH